MSDPDKSHSGLSSGPGEWLPIQLAPDDCDLELGQPHKTGILPLSFPCRRRAGVWFNVWADEAVLISPSHWRIWRREPSRTNTHI
ncbi:hypothetical protein JQ631_07665 [Bradyrhizobium manausense]|jgi:hypothetical protein|uniref:hypothetical protein n=1 Tax=Bradyrhizobium manausense TaxID=989370 RepID=UPI001BA5BF55|nr:hypothetical protein [Bradyrhizobium manausense]MBR0788944.1 hypothetical protein [Bradyrhizobium manausense]